MPVVTIRTKPSQNADSALIRKAQQKATSLLDEANRVLVVYEAGAANIYYEGGKKQGAGPN